MADATTVDTKGADTGAAAAAATTTAAPATTVVTNATAAASTAAATTTTGAAATTDAGVTTDVGKTGGTDATQAKGYWPDDWLARITKGDEKVAKQLGRYASPTELAEAHVALRRRMDSGEVKSALPKDAKPEELTAWRKENGIPEKPEDYNLADLKIPEKDKEVVSGIVARMHAVNASPDVVKAAVETYYAEQIRQGEARRAKDEDQRAQALDALNSEWGGSFRRNVNLVEGLLAKFPESVRDALKSARLPDGTAIFNNPDALRGLAAIALEINPAGVVVPAGGGDLGKTMVDQYNDIQKTKRENRTAYNKDNAMQAHERDLIDAMIKNGIMDNNGTIIQNRKAA